MLAALPLPARLRRLATRLLPPARLALLAEFLRFGTVGAIGFVFDTATVYGSRPWLGLYAGGVLAYLVAASVTWLLNRLWTFRHVAHAAMHRQWAAFLAAQSVGFVLNRGTYAILVTVSPLCAAQPVLAVAAGVAAGMFVNFTLARKLVFR